MFGVGWLFLRGRAMTETDWLATTDPCKVAKFCRGRVEPLRFRWLALDWVGRIRQFIPEEDDRRYFDAFAAWMAGTGEHPDQVCPGPHYHALVRWVHYVESAIVSVEWLRRNDPMTASAWAAESLAEYRPRGEGESIDATKTHRPRSAKKLAILKAEQDERQRRERMAWEERHDRVRREFCEQFRCVSGDPFRPVAFDPRWLSETAVALATGIYAERAFDRMPILADALEEAGCDDADVLSHCRGPGPHVRGCWVVDRVLGKE